jgi:hypothetical protein
LFFIILIFYPDADERYIKHILINGDVMKKNFRRFAVVIIFMFLPVLFVQCNNSKEQSGGKEGEAQKQKAGQIETQAQPQAQPKPHKQSKPGLKLPEKLLTLGLTDAQKAQCEAAYQEIFTPEVVAKRLELFKKLSGMEKGSAEYDKLKKEINEMLKPYYVQFNKKLRNILTQEQQEKYFMNKESQKED